MVNQLEWLLAAQRDFCEDVAAQQYICKLYIGQHREHALCKPLVERPHREPPETVGCSGGHARGGGSVRFCGGGAREPVRALLGPISTESTREPTRGLPQSFSVSSPPPAEGASLLPGAAQMPIEKGIEPGIWRWEIT